MLNVFGFFAVAVLSGSLAEGVRSTGARLEQASNQIADLQALNQHVIDSLPSGLATTDNTGRILTFNRAAENITGRSSTSVVGRPIAEVLHIPEDAVGALAPELDGGRARRMESHYMRSGQHVEIGLSIAYLQTPGGRAGYLVTFQDVTDIKKLERMRACSSVWPPWARWPRASPTKSGTRSRRCRGRFRFSATSCPSARSRVS